MMIPALAAVQRGRHEGEMKVIPRYETARKTILASMSGTRAAAGEIT